MRVTKVAVTQAFFGRHKVLRAELLAKYSDVTFKETDSILEGQDLIDFLRGHDKVIMSIDKLSRDVIEALPELKVVSKFGVGMDSVDVKAMADHGVELGWKGGVNKRTVSEMALCYLLSLIRNYPTANLDMRQGIWKRRPGRALSDRTVGILGCGFIGQDLGRILRYMGCTVLAHDIRDHPEYYEETGVLPVSLDELLERSELISVHLPNTKLTRGILSADRLAQMQPGSILVNTARGGLIDEDALLKALESGHLASAAIDAFLAEPTDRQELVNHPNFFSTPHMGGLSEEAVMAMGRQAIAGLDDHRLPSPDWPPDVWED
ncbi:MAG: phosphoglycerate dehydrogenase [Rhodospirillales bacterium]|nr:phosphoglycerate dehydrogenase [Rhodospirillales bacterium]